MSTDIVAALTATACAPVVFLVHVLLCRLIGARRAIRWMFVAFAAYAALVAWRLSRLPHLDHQVWLSGMATVGFWCLAYMETFSMLCRGFSLSVLVQLADHPGMTLDELMRTYGGVGAEALLGKRLGTLERLGLVDRVDGDIRLRGPIAHALSWSTAAYKRAFRLGAGG